MINIRDEREIAKIRESSRLVAKALLEVREAIRPGVTTKELNDLAEEIIKKGGGIPAFKGYRGYPASLCVSINEEVVHGIPNKR
ncbi:MAG: type I methionyl aminopeptidase, partial [Deltaproteobacteria bacterium]